jgi:hypothetical protein
MVLRVAVVVLVIPQAAVGLVLLALEVTVA